LRWLTIDFGRMRLKEIEERIRKFWNENEIPQKWRSWLNNRPIFSFLEGPPTANGYPHVGHIRGRTYKDMVLRYYRLLGYNIWAQGGWDEQGLPVEVEVEKKLGIKRKKEISDKVGYERFIEECNKLVDYYLEYWKDYATSRLGLWLDLENAYETRKARYIEYVWRLIKYAYENGMLYKGFKVLPFCPRCETALSDAEVDQGYREKTSPSIYVKFRLRDYPDTYLIIWTTTPWTLIDNEAVTIHPDGTYVMIDLDREKWIVAKDLAEDVLKLADKKDYTIIKEYKGSELERFKYIHPLEEEVPIHKKHVDAHYIVLAEFVSLEEGTGLVHTAPGHGPEDYEVGMKYNLPISSNVEVNGVFNEYGGIFKGLPVEEASKKVIETLKKKNLLVYNGFIVHSYPHCWRCDTPLIYRADSQWFIRISKIKEDLLNALQKVKIYPEKLRSRFENWLENIKDWTVSRSRIWGTPLPIWICKDDPNKVLVIGSLEELKKYAKEIPNVDDDKLIHRPWIDMVKIEYDGCREWVREPYVVDVWVDSGLAWIASIDGYRNIELFNKLYPYNFVTEAVDQTRGWFYSLLATSVLLNNIPPYTQILIQGHVLDKYGRKMSKHEGNVIWAKELFEDKSVDASRLYILSRYAPGDPFNFDPDEIKDVISKLNIIWNIFRFTYTYMDLDKFDPDIHNLDKYMDYLKTEDKWILSRINTIFKEYRRYMDSFELHRASKVILDFLVNEVSRVYIRLIRPRVWREEDYDKYVVYSVLYYVLIRAVKMLAPIIPHYTEEIWQKFFRKFNKNAEESIHLSLFDELDNEFINLELEEDMDRVLKVISLISAARNRVGIKLRWPIRTAYIAGDEDTLESVRRIEEIIKFMANVKEVKIFKELEGITDDFETIEEENIVVSIPRKIDEELFYEAMARELIRRIQVMRNELDLRVEEFIYVAIESDSDMIKKAIDKYRGYIMNEVRAKELTDKIIKEMYTKKWSIEEFNVRIGIKRIRD